MRTFIRVCFPLVLVLALFFSVPSWAAPGPQNGLFFAMPPAPANFLATPPGGIHPRMVVAGARPAYVPGELVVKLRQPSRGELLGSKLSAMGGAVATQLLLPDYFLVAFPKDEDVFEVTSRLLQDPSVELAEPNYYYYADFIPNDPWYGFQWNFPQIQMPQAWDLSNGNGVIVAVVDTGVAYEDYEGYARAPDLANTAFVAGWDFVNNDSHPNDDRGHGTHVAGTIAQSTNNGLGVAGIAFGAKIMPIKVLDETGAGTTADIANGIRWAADNGARVLNLSLGGPNHSALLEEAVNYAHGRGVVVVASSGNEGIRSVRYPAAYSNAISVGATRYDRTRASYSNYGLDLDLVAPGGDCRVDQNGDGYCDGIVQQTFASGNPSTFSYYFFQGTSMAAPHVSGVAALLIASGVATTPDGVRLALKSTAKDLGAWGWDQYYGCGLVQAYDALRYPASVIAESAGLSPIGAPSSRFRMAYPAPEPTPQIAFKSFLPLVSRSHSGRMACGNRPLPTPIPTRTPTPSPTPTTNPAFSWSDDFSNSSSGWDVVDSGSAKWSYQSGEYEMLLRNPNWSMWATAPTPGLNSYTFTSDMRRSSGTDSYYGLVFNHLSANSYYLLLVQPGTGQYSIWLYSNPNWTELIGWTSSSRINTGSATNRLGIARSGGDVEAYINGYLVATGTNSTTATNVQIGLRAQSGSSAPVALRFDNFSVSGVRTTRPEIRDDAAKSGAQEATTRGGLLSGETWSVR